MKWICSFLPVLFSGFTGFAQAEFGIFAGPHISTAKYTVKNVKQPTDPKFGFHLGVGLEVAFENKLYFSPALSYSLMGFDVKFNKPSLPPDLLAKDNSIRFHQIDLDFLLQYNFSSKPNHIFFKAGPALHIVMGGREEFNLVTGQHISRKMKYGTSNGDYGPYLASFVVQPGYETLTGFIIYVHYVLGLGSMNNADGGPMILNRVFGITIGKYFRKKLAE